MEEESTIRVKDIPTTDDNIPQHNIYKIHILNDDGNVGFVYVFCAGIYASKNMNELFSEIEIAHYKRNDVEIVFSEKLIHPDDTIRDIKHKIVNEIVEHQKKSKTKAFSLSVEEVYIFGLAEKDLDMVKLYQEITENDTKRLTKEKFYQYATNISTNPYILDKSGGMEKGGLHNDIFTYEQWSGLSKSGLRTVYIPIGMEFETAYDFMFPTNPYKNQPWTEPIRYESSPKNAILTLDKSTLLDYTQSRDLMVCLAKPTFAYADKSNINTEYFCKLYFPFLFKSGLTSSSLLLESAIEIAEESKQYNTSNVVRRRNITQIYREIYWNSDEALSYSERGIKEFALTLRPYEYVRNFPLDLLFRNLHVTEEIPFIKYNPGMRRENMYRLYSEDISTDGKKIPFLEESVVMRLSRELGKSKQITLFVKKDIDLVVNINQNSEIEVLGQLDKVLTVDELNEIVDTMINPIVVMLNSILEPSGYKMRPFTNVQDANIINVRLMYQMRLPIDVKINIQRQMNYITPIFDVLGTDVSKGSEMRFKRIKNYKEMNARSAFIREVYDRTGDSDRVIQGLMDNFDLTQDAAIIAFAEFRSQYQLLKQKIAENPGFKTVFQMMPLKSELSVQVFDIHSIEYIKELEMYIDVILRLSQKPETAKISQDKLKIFKSKEKAKEVVQEVVETVIVPEEKDEKIYKPITFTPQEEEEGEGEGEGIDFDDADFYEGYEDSPKSGDEDVDEEDEEDEEDDFYGGENTPEEEEEEEEYKADIDGMSIKNPTPFFRRMLELDPTLYVTEETGKFPLYSKACASGDKRQPVILTDEEKKKIDETNPGSYGHALYHGSSKDKKHWYICPRYWCLKTNSSISEKDVKAGKCGAIIPRGSDKVPPGAYVYEFNKPPVHMKTGKYLQHVPGLLKKEKHPQGLCIPCCFGKAWDSKDQVKRRTTCGLEGDITDDKINTPQTSKTKYYVIGSVSYPIPPSRWGFLPIALQLFFKTDTSKVVDPENTSIILPGEKCLLRYGVEKSEKQSFFACFAYYYAYKQKLKTIPSIEEMRTLFRDAINIDLFVRYHNGNLVSSFRPKRRYKTVDIGSHTESDFYKTISLDDDRQVEYLENTVASYDNFIKFIENEDSIIDHTYLWDFFCGRNSALLKDGVNLVILQMTDQDITERVQLVCPSNSYSRYEYDETKETVVLLKQDNFYEPIHLYEQTDSIINLKTKDVLYELKKGETLQDNKVMSKKNEIVYRLKDGQNKYSEIIFKKAFVEISALPEIQDILKLIKETSKKYCRPLPSLPKKYNFKHNIGILDLIRILKTHHYTIHEQVLNYRNKAIGLTVNKEDAQRKLFVPCFPSAMVSEIATKYMDEDDLWLDYRTTRDRLNGLSQDTNGQILSKPKIKILEDGLVVGFLTETNQFVQINPPTQSIDSDGIPEVKHYSNKYTDSEKHKSADIVLTTGNTEVTERATTVRNVNLETQFYNIFRTIVRLNLNDFEHRVIRKEIIDTVDDPQISYRGKIKSVEANLIKLLGDKVDFKEMVQKDLGQIERIVLCNQDGNCNDDDGSRPVYCIVSDDGNCVSVFPKKHLLSGNDNEKIYYGRLADELIRYKRSRLFMFYPKNYMNITNTDLFINENELFLLESRLIRDYFRNLTPFGYLQNITYDNAQPDSEYSGTQQNYANKVLISEQHIEPDAKITPKSEIKNFILDCITSTKPQVVGNVKEGSWRRVFPSNAKELVFSNSVNCSFIPLIYIFQNVYYSAISIQNIKTALWNGYKEILKDTHSEKYVYSILKKQGKQDFIEKLKNKQVDFETIIQSDEYYITDLDIWVFCNIAQLPVVLFSSTTLKTLLPQNRWLRVGGRTLSESYYFIRSKSDIKKNIPSSYQVIDVGYKLHELNDIGFTNAIKGDERYASNLISLDDFISKSTIIRDKK